MNFASHVLPVLVAVLGVTFGAGCGSDSPGAATPDAAVDARAPLDARPSAKSALRVFYVVHTHLSDDRLPYDSKLMKETDLNSDKANNMLALIDGIKAVAEKHGLKIAWQPTVGPAKGFCQQNPTNHVFRTLLSDGHEIGIHAHKSDDLKTVYDLLTQDCGLLPREVTSASGYEVVLGDTTGATRAAGFSALVNQFTTWSINVGTSNQAPASDGSHSMSPVCKETWGSTSDSWKTTDNLIYPWKPNVKDAIPCQHDPNGTFVMVDHAGPEWTVSSGTKGALTNAEFDVLKPSLDGALAYVSAHPNDQVAAWGWVTHITEYTRSAQGNTGPDQGALDALDAFLSYIDTKKADGSVVYDTPAAIAKRAYP